jgi:hypothetical protein
MRRLDRIGCLGATVMIIVINLNAELRYIFGMEWEPRWTGWAALGWATIRGGAEKKGARMAGGRV